MKKGAHLSVYCKVNGPSVDGNPRWCPSDVLSKGKVVAKPTLTTRAKATAKSASTGKLAYGKQIQVICKVDGQTVGGNKRWYQLTNGSWAAARYVANLGDAPPYCGSIQT